MKRPKHPRCPACHKARYPSKAAAEADVRVIVARNLHIKKPGWLHAYRCEAGSGWHIGHVPIKRKRR